MHRILGSGCGLSRLLTWWRAGLLQASFDVGVRKAATCRRRRDDWQLLPVLNLHALLAFDLAPVLALLGRRFFSRLHIYVLDNLARCVVQRYVQIADSAFGLEHTLCKLITSQISESVDHAGLVHVQWQIH